MHPDHLVALLIAGGCLVLLGITAAAAALHNPNDHADH